MSSSTPKLSPEDIKLRGSLLAKSKELLKLHKELVFGGLLSEEEFWETRQGLLRGQEATLKQKRGLSAALTTEEAAKPVTGTTGTGDIKYVLTPAIIKGIFETHPILKKAFAAFVKEGEAEGITEKEFWIEYFKSKFFNEKAVPGTNSALLDPYFETESKVKKSSEESGSALEQYSGIVDEMVDISRSLEDHVSSEYVQFEGDAVRGDPHWNAFRQFNLHSLKVLQTCKPTGAKRHIENYIEIYDLQTNAEPALATLNIQESLLGRRKENKIDVDFNYQHVKDALNVSLSQINLRKQEYFIEYSAFKDSMNGILTRNLFSSVNQQQPLQMEPSEDVSHLLNSSLEVLRHFWRAAIMTNSAEKKAKLTKLHQVLEQMEAKVNAFSKTNPTAKQAFFNLFQVFQVAKLKYQELCK